MSDEEAAIPEKIRVPDPVSSSESSEKEEDEKEKAKAANGRSLSSPEVDRVGLETCVGAAQLAWLEKMLVK